MVSGPISHVFFSARLLGYDFEPQTPRGFPASRREAPADGTAGRWGPASLASDV